MSGIELIIQEREKQLKHGYNATHDKKYDDGALLVLAEFLMKEEDDAEKDNLGHELVSSMGFEQEYITKLWKFPRKRQLTIAAALIAAEIDRDTEMPEVSDTMKPYVDVVYSHDFESIGIGNYRSKDMKVTICDENDTVYALFKSPKHSDGVRCDTPEQLNNHIAVHLVNIANGQ